MASSRSVRVDGLVAARVDGSLRAISGRPVFRFQKTKTARIYGHRRLPPALNKPSEPREDDSNGPSIDRIGLVDSPGDGFASGGRFQVPKWRGLEVQPGPKAGQVAARTGAGRWSRSQRQRRSVGSFAWTNRAACCIFNPMLMARGARGFPERTWTAPNRRKPCSSSSGPGKRPLPISSAGKEQPDEVLATRVGSAA
jgi:hypothetical protein